MSAETPNVAQLKVHAPWRWLAFLCLVVVGTLARAQNSYEAYSPVVSYVFQDSLSEAGGEAISPVVSYDYQDTLNSADAYSPVVSYVFEEALPDDVLTTFSSAPVSYYFNVVAASPTILTPPRSQTVNAGQDVGFIAVASGTWPMTYQWRFRGVPISGATSATFTLHSVGAANSGGYSVVVSNPYGTVISAQAALAVLTDGANGNKPGQISPIIAPLPSVDKDSLIMVTHGVELFYALDHPFGDISWITNMANAIQTFAPPNWEVRPFDWTAVSWFPEPDTVAAEGIIGGVLYGQQLRQQGKWKRVHLIGHSAGAAVIEAIASELRKSSSPPVIQETFLDPYLGSLHQFKTYYGSFSDWADNYFAQNDTSRFTGGQLPNAHNVDVTWLDRQNISYLTNYCFPFGTADTTPATIFDRQVPCNVEAYVVSSHSWPHEFYKQSITENDVDAADYGFPRSMEGGGWDQRNQYPTNNTPVVLNGQAARPQNVLPTQSSGLFKLSWLPNATSADGAIFSGDNGFSLSSFSSVLAHARPGGNNHPLPQGGSITNGQAWLALGVPVTNAVNFVEFSAGFIDTNAAEGLLTVYWNTNLVGMVDERVSSSGLQTYRFALPGTETNGLFTLSFRLDSFANASSVTVTNVATGFVGVTQPITLAALGLATNGAPVLQLSGAPGYTSLIQASTNLLDWTPTALLVNTNGTVLFAEPGLASRTARFYRATLP